MFSLNPLGNSILQTGDVQRTQATDKDRQTRRTTELTKNVALDDDRLEHQVESSDTVTSIHDEQPRQQSRQKQREGEEEQEHLDVRA